MTALLGAVFADALGYGMVIPLLPFYVSDLSGGAVVVGLLGSLYAGAQLFSGPVLGGVSDRLGRRPVLLVCIAGTATAYLTIGLSGTLYVLVAALILDGVTGGNLAIAQAYAADSTAAKHRARGMGLVGAAFGAGLVAGPAAGGLLSLHTPATPVLAASALAFANLLFATAVLPESLPPPHRRQTPLKLMNPLHQLKGVLNIAGLRLLLAVVFLINLPFAVLVSNFPLFTRESFGWSPSTSSLLFAFAGLCAIITQAGLLRVLLPHLGEQRLLPWGLAAAAAALALIGLTPSGWTLYPLVGLLAVGSGLAIPSLTSLLSRRASTEAQGTLMGGQQAIMALAMVSGPVLAGLAFEGISPATPYLAAGVVSAVAVAIAAAALRPRYANGH